MLFSGKITNAVINDLESKRFNPEHWLEGSDLPIEFLRDPSYWLTVSEMESFLRRMRKQTGADYSLKEVGRMSSELEAWGVLDNVLRMMDDPGEIFLRPQRFISYFISPPPPLEEIEIQDQRAVFRLPIASEEYPEVADYMIGAFEGLPRYFSRELAEVKWHSNALMIEWTSEQPNLFGEAVTRQVSPQMLQKMVESLEKGQRLLEERNRELLEKNQRLEVTRREIESRMNERIHSEKLITLSELAVGVAHEINSPIAYVSSNLSRLQDYMGKAQELIAQFARKADNEGQAWLKQSDWEYISQEFPRIVNESEEGLKRIQAIVRDLSFLARTSRLQEGQKAPADINHVVERALQVVQAQMPENIRLDRHLLLSQPVRVDAVRLEQALINLLNNAVQAIEGEGTVRVITRPNGARAEIEITDTGVGMDAETLRHIFTPYFTTKRPGRGTGLGLSIAHSIVKMHEGQVRVSSDLGRGSTFVIDLPH